MSERLGAPLPAQLRIAIGFTSSGRRSRNIGECWDNQCLKIAILKGGALQEEDDK